MNPCRKTRSCRFTGVRSGTLLLIFADTFWSFCNAGFVEKGSSLTTIKANLSVQRIRDLYKAGHKTHPNLCRAHGHHLNLILIVFSAPENFRKRNAIRLTWGQQAKYNKIPLVFVIGTSPGYVLKAVVKEHKTNKDIIIGNPVDSYANLTLKMISALEWVKSYCHKVKMVVKTDDDVFINVAKLISFIQIRINTTNTIWGWLQHNIRPERSSDKKYCLPIAQFKGETLPDFTAGPTYILSGDVVSPLYSKSLSKTKTFFNLEDVFFTGILAEELNISREDAVEINNKKIHDEIHPCVAKNVISLHGVEFNEQSLYQGMLSEKNYCWVSKNFNV